MRRKRRRQRRKSIRIMCWRTMRRMRRRLWLRRPRRGEEQSEVQ